MKLSRIRKILAIIMIVSMALLVIGTIVDESILSGVNARVTAETESGLMPSMTPAVSRKLANTVRSVLRTGRLNISDQFASAVGIGMRGYDLTRETLVDTIDAAMEALDAESPFVCFAVRCWAWFPFLQALMLIVLVLSMTAFILSRIPRFVNALARKWPKRFGDLTADEEDSGAPVWPLPFTAHGQEKEE